jgi:hypothetical protein
MKRSRAWLGTEAQAERCTFCGKPLWRIDPKRRKTPEGVPLGYEPTTRESGEGSCCWNGKACLARRMEARAARKQVIEFAKKLFD